MTRCSKVVLVAASVTAALALSCSKPSGSGGTGQTPAPDAGGDPGVDASSTPDTPDAGSPDAGPPDAGSPDAGSQDAGAPDAGVPDAGPVIEPPVRLGSWTYYGTAQGLSPNIHDVSADEGGNVYVAGDVAVYAKARSDEQFLQFDAENAGLSKMCNDAAYLFTQPPPTPMVMCPVLSVAGASPGKALIGFWGFGVEGDPGADWALDTGGVDVVAFDGQKMTRTRHVLTGAPPHVVCDYGHTQWLDQPCVPGPGVQPLPSLPWWDWGRRLFRRVNRIAVNHDGPDPLMYGDAWMGGGHATMAVLLANTSQRNWKDTVAGLGPTWADMRDFWEHHHPIVVTTRADGVQVENYGEGYAMSISPVDGRPWASNGFRTASVSGYGGDLTYRNFGLYPVMDLWPDGKDPYPIYDAQDDFVRSLTHCQDGTIWAGSITHGLAHLDAGGALIGYVALPKAATGGCSAWPDGCNFGALSVACDWSDNSLWIGVASGGVLRLKDGTFTAIQVTGAPAFASQPVQNIQLDRWSKGGRVVYFAFGAVKDATTGAVTMPGGIAAYDGP